MNSNLLNALLSILPCLIAVGMLCGVAFLPRLAGWITAAVIAVAGAGAAIYLPLEESLHKRFYLSLSINLLGTAAFIYGLSFFKKNKLKSWFLSAKNFQKNNDQKEKERLDLKKESEELEKEAVRTVRTYGVVKGLGEALNWNEMAPHIDYAVQNCMGFRDYSLYLMDDRSELQKTLSRGSKMVEPPIAQPTSKAKWHRKGHETYLEIPILKGHDLIALLWMRISPGMAESSEQLLMDEAVEISEELVMGLEKARLFSSLERLSRYDGLTGVHRRQIFDERINEEIRRSGAFRTNFSVLLCDLDHFKSINDTYGHQAGDEVLRRLGGILKGSIYETDFVARYGGEEFVVLFPQADPVGVQRKAEMIRKRIESEKFVFGWNEIVVTTSIGIAHYPVHGNDPASILSAADRALYYAKESGRNRVVDASQIR